MNVGELREALEDLDDEVVLRIATQPNWPLRFGVRSIITPGDLIEYNERENEDHLDDEDDGPQFVWIVTGDHPHDESPYASKDLWDI